MSVDHGAASRGYEKELEELGIKIVKELPKLMERVRRVFRETGSVREAMKVRGMLTEHEVLRICAEERLKAMGYRIIRWDEAPEQIKAAGSPDIIAEKNGEYVLVEVKVLDQLRRYSESGAHLILVTNVEYGRCLEVWGFLELEKAL